MNRDRENPVPHYMFPTSSSATKASITSENTRRRKESSRESSYVETKGKSHYYPQYKQSYMSSLRKPPSGPFRARLSANCSIRSVKPQSGVDVHLGVSGFAASDVDGLFRQSIIHSNRNEDNSDRQRSVHALHDSDDYSRHHGSQHDHQGQIRRRTSDTYLGDHSSGKYTGSDGVYPSRRSSYHYPRSSSYHVPTPGHNTSTGINGIYPVRRSESYTQRSSQHHVPTTGLFSSDLDERTSKRQTRGDYTSGLGTRKKGSSSYYTIGRHDFTSIGHYDSGSYTNYKHDHSTSHSSHSFELKYVRDSLPTYKHDTDDLDMPDRTRPPAAWTYETRKTDTGFAGDTFYGASDICRRDHASEIYRSSSLPAGNPSADGGPFKTNHRSVWEDHAIEISMHDSRIHGESLIQNKEPFDQQLDIDGRIKVSADVNVERAARLDQKYSSASNEKATKERSLVVKANLTDDKNQRPPASEKASAFEKAGITDIPEQRRTDNENVDPVVKTLAVKDEKWNGARPKEIQTKNKKGRDDDDAPYEKYDHRQHEWEKDKAIEEKSLNLQFYKNEMKSKPWGCKIEEMLKWQGDYHKLESNHSYIQWLFPTQEYSNFNSYVQPIQIHEAEAIRDNPELQERFLRAYKMMLDFYGMELKCKETGEIERSKNWQDRFSHLNRSHHNFYRITRILIALGIFGFEHFQAPWLMFMMHQKFIYLTLPDIPFGVMHHWIGAVNNDTSRDLVVQQFKEFSDKWNAEGRNSRPGSRRSKALVPSQQDKLGEKIDNLHVAQRNHSVVTSHSDKVDEKLSKKQDKSMEVEMTEIKSSDRGLHTDDVNLGLDRDDNDKMCEAGKLERMDTTEYADGRPQGASGNSVDDKNIKRDDTQAPPDKRLASVNYDRNNGKKEFERSLSDTGVTSTFGQIPVSDGAPQPDLGLIEQFDTSSKSTVSYIACASGGGGESVPNKQLERPHGGFSQSVIDRSDRHTPRILLDRSLSWRGENDKDHHQYTEQYSQDDGLAFDNLNLKFYKNEIVSRPEGRKIEQILEMKGDHAAIEENPAFFQWLFPTQQPSRSNRFAKPLQVNEAEAIRDTPELKDRFLRAYKMMLDFYGMELKNEATGEIQRNPSSYRERLIYLNRSPSDHPRITRILTSLGILGFEHYQLPWLRFLMRETFKEGTLAAIPAEVLQQHWVGVLQKEEDQMNAVIYFTTLQDEKKQEI